jgi:ER lumen protein retaining receptor
MTWLLRAADAFHVTSFFMLLLRLGGNKSTLGISLKTQELYFLVFCTRYVGLFFGEYFSIYDEMIKVLYVCLTAYIIYTIRYWGEYDSRLDSFRHWTFAVVPCICFALFTGLVRGYKFLEILWIFSIFLEALAIVPQLITLHRYRETQNLTVRYVFFLGWYRLCYLAHWCFESREGDYRKWDWLVIGCTVVQSLFFFDFFYLSALGFIFGAKYTLPH